MDISFAFISKILLNPYVIVTAVAVVLYMNFCCYVANYVKKAPKPKNKKKSKPAPAPAPAQAPAEGAAPAGDASASAAPAAPAK